MTLTTIKRAGLDGEALDHVFTIGASGSSAYTFQGEGLNGTVNNPTLYLTRGKTYRFENGSGGHPIRIQSTSGASGTAYNTGVTNNAGSGTVIVEVQHDAPDVLYYQCTSHAAMNGTLYITGALADGGVSTAKLADSAVTTAKLAGSAVSTGAIANNAVTSAKIAALNVTTGAIADDAVTTAKLALPLSLADGEKIRFGTDNDLQIYHESNNSWIKETGSGSMNINTNRLNVANAADNEVLINAQEDGAVDLYYNGTKRFETTNTGATVTGDLNVTGLNVATEIVHLNDTDTKIEFADNRITLATAGSDRIDVRHNKIVIGHADEITINDEEAIRLNIPENTDLDNAGNNRDTKGKITIAAGDADNATPDDDCTVIQIVPEQTRSSVVGSKHGGIGWQHLTPLNWTGYQGNQIWMGSSLHDTVGQERANFQIWMNNQTGQGSQPNNHAFNLSPEGYHSFPKTPVYIGEGTDYSQSSSSFTVVEPHYNLTIRGITRSGGEFTVPEDGIYSFNLNALWHPGAESIYYSMILQVNGSQAGDMIQGGQTQTQHGHFHFHKLVSVSASDVIRVLFKASGGAVYGGQANWGIYKVA